jgi:hypothetical protein
MNKSRSRCVIGNGSCFYRQFKLSEVANSPVNNFPVVSPLRSALQHDCFGQGLQNIVTVSIA